MHAIKSLTALLLLTLCLDVAAMAQGIDTIGPHDLKQIVDSSKGRVLIVNFWATWCGPCVKEFPALTTIRQEFPERDLHIVGISLDYSPKAVDAFVTRQKINFPVYIDNGDIGSTLSVKSIPRTMIYSPAGEMILDHLGIISEEGFRHIVKKASQMR